MHNDKIGQIYFKNVAVLTPQEFESMFNNFDPKVTWNLIVRLVSKAQLST